MKSLRSRYRRWRHKTLVHYGRKTVRQYGMDPAYTAVATCTCGWYCGAIHGEMAEAIARRHVLGLA